MSSAGKLMMMMALITVVSGQCEEKCHCSKYKVFCSLARLRGLPTRILETTELVKIEFDNISEISNSTGLQTITHFQLVNVGLREIEPGAFQNMSRLQYLAITHNNITLLKTGSFKYLDQLYSLNLSNNEIEHLSPGTFSGIQNIRILDLSYNKIEKFEANAFEGMRCSEISTAEYENFFRHFGIEPVAFKYISALTYFQLTRYTSQLIPKQTPFGVRIYDWNEIEYVNRNNRPEMSELLYLNLWRTHLGNLTEIKFQNFTKLKYLDLSWNEISEITPGNFEGLVSLKILKLDYNFMDFLHNGTFRGLQSLEILNVSICGISRIESRAFEGLSKLRTLDLRGNLFHALNSSTFSKLPMLKELILPSITFMHIDYGSFANVRNIKSLLNEPSELYHITDTSDIENLKSLNTISETKFVQLQRLDNLRLFVHITIPKEIQILNALHLYIHAGYDDPLKELRRVLETMRYVRSLSVSLLKVNPTQFLPTFYEFRISKLTMSFSNWVYLNTKKLSGLSTLKSLTISPIFNFTIEGGAFRDMKELKELRLSYNSSFRFTNGMFLGLNNLAFLSIKFEFIKGYNDLSFPETYENIEGRPVDGGVFIGLGNLTELRIRGNNFIGLKPGAFEGLDKIEEIDLSYNHIQKIEAGVFGAICKKEFEISCKNVTLQEYCNNTNALKTLIYLDLTLNNISHIHPHAFISCTNLQILVLAYNKFLTLDIPFLYTPGLRKLDMSACSISNIHNETFACTPLLSEINFEYSSISKLTLSALLPLRLLQNIYFEYNNLSCDCGLYESWRWLRENRVNDDISCTDRKTRSSYSPKMANVLFSNMPCNDTMTNNSVSQNRTTDTNDFAFFKQYVESIVLIIILTFGLVSNGFLLFIALRNSDMRTKHNACIIHLSTVELFSLILNLPLSYWDVVNIRWEFDDTLCKFFVFSKDVGVAVTAFSAVALSVERFSVARIFRNLKKMCKTETQPTAWLLLMTWISATVWSLPAYFSARVFEGRCLYCPPGNQSYIRNVWTFQLVMYCLLPAFAISFLNVKTFLFLRASIREIPGEIRDKNLVKNRRKVANVALILVLVFVASYLPNYILRLLVAWSLLDMKDLFLPSFFTFCLFFCNAVFNPNSIFIMSSKFKSYAFRYFPFLENVQQSRPVPLIANKNDRRHKKSGGYQSF